MNELKGWSNLIDQVKVIIWGINMGATPEYITGKLKEALDKFGRDNRMDVIDWNKPFDDQSGVSED